MSERFVDRFKEWVRKLEKQVLVVIYEKSCLDYHIFYKPSFLDKILGRRLTITDDEYRLEDDPRVQEILKRDKEWIYLGSGDTVHTYSWLRTHGLIDFKDVWGLKEYFRKRFDGEILFEETLME